MAFNWPTFKTRALTAVIFAVVMLAGLLLNQWSFLILFSLIHFGCWWEYFKLIGKINQVRFHVYTKLGLILVGYGWMLWFSDETYQINGFGIKENLFLPVSLAGFVLLAIGIFQKNKLTLKAMGAAVCGLVYISLSWGMFLSLYKEVRFQQDDMTMVLLNGTLTFIIIISIWINDTMAYIVGSLIGKTPLSKISPKKTWEGTIGGIILSVGVAGLLSYYGANHGRFTINVMIIAAIAAVAGTLGDLLESKLKRMAGVKDSGSLMPGHGGFLDRFDSLLVATPFCWIYIKLILI